MRYIYSGFLCVLSLLSYGQDSEVLFIGNSYTYFWNLPQVVSALAESQSIDIWTEQSTIGGADLGQHWHSQRDLKSRDLIKERDWDYVVLQDHSLRSINKPDSLNHYMDYWIKEIKSTGAKPLLYMTWSRFFDPTMISTIAPTFESIAADHDVPIVPVGRIWAEAKQMRPDIALYDPDGSHPSPLGTYLTACAFYSVLTGNSAKGLPNRLTSKDEFGEKIYLMIVSAHDAQYCQAVVDHVLSTYGLD